MKREKKFKSYVRNKNTGEISTFIWLPFIDSDSDTLKSYEEVVAYGLEWIGLHDKNGKEIYESDVVKTEGYTGKVEYCHQAAQWHIIWHVGKVTRYMPFNANYGDETGYFCDYIEVIGNIYVNPELIK